MSTRTYSVLYTFLLHTIMLFLKYSAFMSERNGWVGMPEGTHC